MSDLKKRIPLTAVFILIAFLSTKHITDRDVLGHLAIGKYIVQHRAFIYEDPFSYITKGVTYVDLNWLYQVAIYASHSVNPNLISLLQTPAVLAVFALLVLSFKIRNTTVTAVILLLGFFCLYPRIQGRPETLTFLFMSAFLLILQKRREGKNYLYLLVPLQVIWVNVHSLAVFGPVLIGIFLLSQPKKSRQLLPALLLTVASLFINPYGYKWAQVAFGQFFQATQGGSVFKGTLSEILPPIMYLQSGHSVPYFILVFFAATVFLVYRTRLTLLHVFLVLPFFFLSISAFRNTSVFAVVTVFTLLSVINSDNSGKPEPSGRLIKIAAAVSLAVLFFIELRTGNLMWKIRHETGFGMVMDESTSAACLYAKEKNLVSPNLYNNEKTSSYIMWFMGPDVKVYSDFRLGLAPEHFYREQMESITNPAVWRGVEKKYSINTIFWDYTADHPLLNNVVGDPDWVPVYLNYKIAIFTRKDRIPRGTDPVFMKFSAQKLLNLYNKTELAYLNFMPVSKQMQVLMKYFYDTSFIIGAAQEHLGQYGAAIEIYRSMIAFAPAHPLTAVIKERLANCYNKTGYEK